MTVYDKDAHADARNRDWTMSVHWSLQHLQRILPDEVLVNIQVAYTDPFYPFDDGTEPLPFFNGPTGAVAYHVPAPDIRRLSRTRFRQVCTQGLDIRWEKRLVDITLGEGEDEPPVRLTFEDGETAEADFVVGADGTNSKVRRWLVGEEAGRAKASAWSMCNGIVCYGDKEKALFLRNPHPLCSLAFSEHGLALCASKFSPSDPPCAGISQSLTPYRPVQNVPDPEKPETWCFNVLRFFERDTEHMAGEMVIDQMKNMSHDICEPFWSAIQWIPEGSRFFATQLDYWVTAPWDNRGSRVTLAGDAAHAMLPSTFFSVCPRTTSLDADCPLPNRSWPRHEPCSRRRGQVHHPD